MSVIWAQPSDSARSATEAPSAQVSLPQERFEVREAELASPAFALVAVAGGAGGADAAPLLDGAAAALECAAAFGVGETPELIEHAGSRQGETDRACRRAGAGRS